jgi:hypothetical protein
MARSRSIVDVARHAPRAGWRDLVGSAIFLAVAATIYARSGEATLEAGGILRYTLVPSRSRLWLRIGAPWKLELSLNGKPATALPPGPGNALVTRGGLRSA